ncbi:MAG: type II secretion system minor pseudopilin GspI [Pseudomonadota bacterium]
MNVVNPKNVKSSSSRLVAGFTLVEVMIALVIVATALPSLVILVMAQVQGSAHVREKTYAMWIAENELTRLTMLNNNKKAFPTFKLPEKDAGTVEMMGLQWQWQIETTKEDEIPGLVKINVGVALLGVAEGGGYKGAKITTKLDNLASLTGYMSE